MTLKKTVGILELKSTRTEIKTSLQELSGRFDLEEESVDFCLLCFLKLDLTMSFWLKLPL